MATGLRVCEGLALKTFDFIGTDVILIRRRKRQGWTFLPLPMEVYLFASKNALPDGTIFTIGYKYFYRFLKKNFGKYIRTVNKKNMTVTHAMRYMKIEDFLYSEKLSLPEICKRFGWKNKQSVAYYLK